MSRACRHRTAWIVLVTMWLGLLLPALAHATAEPGATAWTEICTAQGMKRVPVVAEAVSDADAEGVATVSLNGALDHCPWCTLASAPAVAPPPAAPVLWLPPAGAVGHPERFFTAPRTPHTWRASRPRGPPLLLG